MKTPNRLNRPTLNRLNDLSLRDLRLKVKRFQDAYHNTSVPVVPDDVYDAYERELKRRNPNDPLLTRVGAVPVTGKKVLLPYAMPSLPKIRSDDNAQDYLRKKRGTFDVSLKIDGVSALVENYNGKLRMFTRGDGTTGQDISHLLPYISGIGTLRPNEAVRGEIVLPTSNFSATWADQFKNPRNAISGLVNSTKSPNVQLARQAVFIVHNMLNPVAPLRKAAIYLKSKGWTVVPIKTFTNPSVQDLEEYYELQKDQAIYEMDGLVLTKPDGESVAFKPAVSAKPATVKHIVWQISQHGIYTPVIILKTPVSLSGVSVTRASGANARNVVKLGIGPGARVLVSRAGDVIPKVVGVITKAKPNWPDDYIWDANKVNIRANKLTSEQEITLKAKRLSASLRILNVPNIRERSLVPLVKAGIDSLYELIVSTDTDFEEAGLGPTQADQLYTNLKAALQRATHVEMMWASGFWPRGFADVRFDTVLRVFPFDALRKISTVKLLREVAELPGYSPITAKEFVTPLKKYIDFIDEIDWKPRLKKFRLNDPLYNQVIVFTGFRNNQWDAQIKSRGGKVASGVTKNTTMVVYSGPISAKVTKAKELGIRTMRKDDFRLAFNLT